MIKCKNCGKINENLSKYCNECGKKLDNKTEHLLNYDDLIKKFNLTKSQIEELKIELSKLNKNPTEDEIISIIHNIIIKSFNSSLTIDENNIDKNKYEKELSDLKNEYETKIKKTTAIIIEVFSESKMTQEYFLSYIAKLNHLYNEEISIIEKIINFNESSRTLEKELKKRIKVLKLMINKINSLINELIININQDKENTLDNTLEELDELIKSVKDY